MFNKNVCHNSITNYNLSQGGLDLTYQSKGSSLQSSLHKCFQDYKYITTDTVDCNVPCIYIFPHGKFETEYVR